MNLFKILTITLCLVLFSGGLNISSSSGHPSSLNVNVLTDGNIEGSFTKGGGTLYFEIIRGKLNPRRDPDAPAYQMSIRVMDRNQVPFLNQIGGHEPARFGWREDQEIIAELDIDFNDRLTDFMIITDMIKALINYAEKHKNTRVQINALISLLGSFKESELLLEDMSYVPDCAPPKYSFKTTIRKKPFIGKTEHSALLIQVYDSKGRFLYSVETCNHGTCASDKKMSTKCSKTFKRTDIQAHAWDVMCDFYGYPYGSHLCNGDTRQEYLSVKYGKDQDWGVCGTAMTKAPNCD